MIKNTPAMLETWVQSLGPEDSLEKDMATTPAFLPGESHGQRSLAGYSPRGHRVGHDWATNTHFSLSPGPGAVTARGVTLCDAGCGWEDRGGQRGLKVSPLGNSGPGYDLWSPGLWRWGRVFALRPPAGTRVLKGRTQLGVQGGGHLGEAKSQPVSASLSTRWSWWPLAQRWGWLRGGAISDAWGWICVNRWNLGRSDRGWWSQTVSGTGLQNPRLVGLDQGSQWLPQPCCSELWELQNRPAPQGTFPTQEDEWEPKLGLGSTRGISPAFSMAGGVPRGSPLAHTTQAGVSRKQLLWTWSWPRVGWSLGILINSQPRQEVTLTSGSGLWIEVLGLPWQPVESWAEEQQCSLSGSGGRKSETKVSAGPAPCGGVRGRSPLASSSFWGLQSPLACGCVPLASAPSSLCAYL